MKEQQNPDFPSNEAAAASSGRPSDNAVVIPSNIRQRQRRQLIKLQKFTRFPVWPAWNGVFIWLVSKFLGDETASELEEFLGGRVCPNFFVDDNSYSDETTSPFLLLVHHTHSFAPFDLGRYFQRAFILPEGFPAHPHRGFVTLTYFLKGGFRHRDSMGIEQYYGAVDDDEGEDTKTVSTTLDTTKNRRPHSQWLNTGAGLLHEELFDLKMEKNAAAAMLWPQRHELYQIWINLPGRLKMRPPAVQLLSDGTDTPVVVEDGATVRVLAGTFRQQYHASTPIATQMMILHVTLDANARWTCPVDPDMKTCFLYVRQGSLKCWQDDPEEEAAPVLIPVHSTAHFSSSGGGTIVDLQAASNINRNKKTDFIFLAAVPLREPCVAKGSMVMNTEGEIAQAYADYQAGLFGQPWDYKLSREEWQEHVKKYPSRYTYNDCQY